MHSCFITYIFSLLSSLAVTCPPVMAISEALSVDPPVCTSNATYLTECRFSCKSGYALHGTAIKTCTQSGTWSPQGNPYCTGGSKYVVVTMNAPVCRHFQQRETKITEKETTNAYYSLYCYPHHKS